METPTRLGAARWRWLALGTLVVAAGGCDRDPLPACAATYQHLVALAKRNPEPDGQAKFVTACSDAWDPKRIECLDAARSVGEALACKPVKKRPG